MPIPTKDNSGTEVAAIFESTALDNSATEHTVVIYTVITMLICFRRHLELKILVQSSIKMTRIATKRLAFLFVNVLESDGAILPESSKALLRSEIAAASISVYTSQVDAGMSSNPNRSHFADIL